MRKTLHEQKPKSRRKKVADTKLPHGKRSARSLRTWKVWLRKERRRRLVAAVDEFNAKMAEAEL